MNKPFEPEKYFSKHSEVAKELDFSKITLIADLIKKNSSKNTIFTMGNGGSATMLHILLPIGLKCRIQKNLFN